MSSLNVRLTEDLKAFVDERAAEGGYEGPEAYVRALVEAERQLFSPEIRRHIELAQQDLAAGNFTDYDAQSLPALGDEIKRAGRERMAAQRAAPRS